jgi:hypothetical protein
MAQADKDGDGVVPFDDVFIMPRYSLPVKELSFVS